MGLNFRLFFSFFGLLLLVYIIWKVGLLKLYSSFIVMDPFFLVLSFVVYFVVWSLLIQRWKYFIYRQGFFISRSLVFKYSFIAFFFSFVTPLGFGALSKGLYLSKKLRKPFLDCSFGIIFERILDFFVIFLMGCVGFLIFFYKKDLLWLFWLTLFLICVFSFLFVRYHSYLFFKCFVPFFVPKRFKVSVLEFSYKVRSFISLKFVFNLFLRTVLIWFFHFLHLFILFKSFSVDFSFLIFVFSFAAATMVGLLPITISGLGLREFVLVYLFSFYGLSLEIVVIVSLVSFFLVNLPPVIIGFIFSMLKD